MPRVNSCSVTRWALSPLRWANNRRFWSRRDGPNAGMELRSFDVLNIGQIRRMPRWPAGGSGPTVTRQALGDPRDLTQLFTTALFAKGGEFTRRGAMLSTTLPLFHLDSYESSWKTEPMWLS